MVTTRDWVFMGLGLGIGFFVFSTLGRRTMLAGMGLGKAEIERAIGKIEEKAEERRVLEEKEE